MFVLGADALGIEAQRIVADDPRFADVIALPDEEGLLLYQWAHPAAAPRWFGHHILWARICRVNAVHYRLYHQALSGQWQELDIVGDLEYCIEAIRTNRYHLFFG